MKVILYQDQKKITVGNISIPNLEQIKEDDDFQMYNFRITSTRGLIQDNASYDADLEKEIAEGINWRQETVN